MKYIAPSITATAFNCPHCGVLTTQFWHLTYANDAKKGQTPFVVLPDDKTDFEFEKLDDEKRARSEKLVETLKKGRPFLWNSGSTSYSDIRIYNVNFSRCYECSDLAVWVFDRLIYPTTGEAPPPNPDLPDEIKADYLEASSILHLSPRGAAALVRLCIQKLCIHLNQPGKNINNDIKALVAAGLDERVQRALDAVRVIGNNAVHPGKIDIGDDLGMAQSLFRLLNVVAEKMISEPKHVDEVYALLPPTALAQIAERDKK
ncbi:DUF4145 domain-containing protein [Rhizobium laguerreae]|uniref:DUF4145 domain-containing protein n=1 Tax=Rhizobium laguerreae TaxID=1076926 RepID=UPI00103AAE9D|nr:DUF4145 domain-containing protein [Rhizobium laguerreae]MBY3248903.1 DUF4145 domain-containing protein [Rhizobium laguerreae]MBY3299501.1 DUF4145 domain-containing protein [Rhizobium laguerreae]MBY3309968.1 DUF4145 domain-containing protein [Rhizobium laguerreae]MBY3322716.1 DUF4145 domain-containing protein [Rhizobium laguerreae]MBY3391780.1 DUF4145 domain-containing protein [Rhizobium laguerreae]